MGQEKVHWQMFYQVRTVMKSKEKFSLIEKTLMNYRQKKEHKREYFLAFQYPLEIPGVNTNIFLKTSLNAIRKAKGEKELDTLTFLKLIKEKATELGIDEKFLSRQLNVGFSGGEKKKNEILQMKLLEPKAINFR